MRSRMSIARCCCEGAVALPCTLCSDAFDRSDSTDITTGSDCGWAEDSGNPEISSNKLRFTAAGIARSTTVQAGIDPRIIVSVEASGSDGATARILFDYVDASNYKMGEVVFGQGGYLRLAEVVAGVITERVRVPVDSAETLFYTISSPIQIALCYRDSIASFISGNFNATYDFGSNVNGVVALATSSMGTGTQVTFDEFLFAQHQSEEAACPFCERPCPPACDSSPMAMRIAFALVADGTCGDCDDVSLGFNRSFDVPLGSPGGDLCLYFLDIRNELGCTTSLAEITIEFILVGAIMTIEVEVFHLSAFGTQRVQFRYDGSILNCMNLVSQNIPFNFQLGSTCNWTGATCALTSLP